MVIKKWIKNKWFRRSLFVLIGALGGFAYYYFIGCTGNACPIGFVLSVGGKQREKGSEV